MKNAIESAGRIFRNRYFLLGTRGALGAIFVLAGAGKLPEQAKFVEVVSDYGLLSYGLAQAYGSVLPWLELVLGSFLVAGLLSRISAGVSILTIASFLVANGTAVYKYEFCPCFGDAVLVKTSDALVMDVAMLAMAFLILLCGSGALSLDGIIRRKFKEPNSFRWIA
jgi:uncharacterized membrane protein YphA (DoxX/SURF4 family)